MKRFFTLTIMALLLGITAGSAQVKKTWDFSKGWSDETLANLEAGSEWTYTSNSWQETGKFGSGPFVANGIVIKELIGLERSSAGLSKSNNYLLTNSTFRLNRANQELIFPSLKNGQRLTVKGRSANATATNRGVLPMYDYMVRVDEDKANNIMLGGSVEGSKGEYTFIYEIQTSEAGEVPVGIKMNSSSGGIDFTLFMIDDGDPIIVTKTAYICNGNPEGELAYQLLLARENTEVTIIDASANPTLTADDLRGYELTVISPSLQAGNSLVQTVKEAMPWTPVLNLNAAMYEAWSYGTTVEALNLAVVKSSKSDLVKGVNIQTEDEISFIEVGGERISAVVPGEYFAGDAAPLIAMSFEGTPLNDTFFAHIHNEKHNGYIYLAAPAGDWSDDMATLFLNAVTMLAESKSEITNTPAPVIMHEYKNLNTNVTITPGRQLNKTLIYYTTDGTIPTTESNLYTGMLNVTTPTTFKAIAVAEGYLPSEVTTYEVDIKEQPKTPVIKTDFQDGQTIVTLTCASEDAVLWFNFESEVTNDTLKSTKYTEPFSISAPKYVTAFAVAGNAVWSELATQRVVVKNARVVADVAGHFTAQQWTTDNNPGGLNVANGKGMFSWGASAASMYTGIGTPGVDEETGDEIIIYGPEDMREPEAVNEPGENPEWVLKSRGTCLIWQNTGAQTTNFGDDSNYNPLYSTDIDPLFPVTKNDIQFYKFYANEPGNGSIESLNKYQAPLDVVVLANMAGGPLLAQISADGENWTTIGEIEKTGFSRMWSKYTLSYDGTDEVYVRITQEEASGGAKVFDIYVANQGENSLAIKAQYDAEYEEFTQGITTVATTTSMPAGIYTLSGVRTDRMQQGLNIVVRADGTVQKILVK